METYSPGEHPPEALYVLFAPLGWISRTCNNEHSPTFIALYATPPSRSDAYIATLTRGSPPATDEPISAPMPPPMTGGGSLVEQLADNLTAFLSQLAVSRGLGQAALEKLAAAAEGYGFAVAMASAADAAACAASLHAAQEQLHNFRAATTVTAEEINRYLTAIGMGTTSAESGAEPGV